MSISRFTLAVVIGVSLSKMCLGQGTPKVGFPPGNALTGPGTVVRVPEYHEYWASFRSRESGGTFEYVGYGAAGRPRFLTNNNSLAFSPADSLVLTLPDIPSFRVLQLDVAEYTTNSPATTIRFLGYKRDGSIVTNIFTTDPTRGPNGFFQDFRGVGFGVDFQDITRLEVPPVENGWSLAMLYLAYPAQFSSISLSNSNPLLRFMASPSTLYTAQYSLDFTNWFNVDGGTVLLTNGSSPPVSVFVTDTNGVAGQRFYRLKVQ